VAETWNQFGGLLDPLCASIKVSPAQAVAVLIVESGGTGFKGERMIIRFENHIFYDYRGKKNRTLFDKHFRYDPAARWRGHMYSDGFSAFVPVHNGGQDSEWRVFEAACRLDENAALQSISMGAPQIMGFN
jgi:hypothetical protein